jgi:fatty-acyl-CoA synthase
MQNNQCYIHQQVQKIAAEDPQRIVVYDNNKEISYSDLQEMVCKFRQRLTDLNVAQGDRVAFLSPPSVDYLIAYLAITSYGAIFLGLNPKYTYREFTYVINDAQPKVLFSRQVIRGRNYVTDLNKLVNDNPSIAHLKIYNHYEELLADTQDSCTNTLEYHDPCALIYTSGTTGNPKGALISHGGLVECSLAQHHAVNLERPIVLNNLPINHIGCVGDMTAYTLIAGGALVFQEKFNAAEVLDFIQQYGISFWGQIPTMFQLSLDEQDKFPRDLSSVRSIYTSGAPAPIPLLQRLRKICPRIQNAYGMTETVGSICWVKEGDDELISSSIGKPITPYNVRVADDDNNAVQNTLGEIQVKGNMHMLGYWRNPEATAEAYTCDGWLRTGDLAIEESDGNFRLVGRIKEMYKSGGYNVYPREVEHVLEALDGVAAAVVVAVPDSLFHEVGYAYIVEEQNQRIELDGISSLLKKNLANYKIPKYFKHIKNLPQLPNGKIDRPLLSERAINEYKLK